jgi:DNA-damage-inducible protein D
MSPLVASFEKREGKIYVSANVLGQFLGYRDASNFRRCVNSARIIASRSGISITDNFLNPRLFDQDQDDVWLSVWAASAAIMEADSTKPRVAATKSYFASLVDEEFAADEARLKERQTYKHNHRMLHGAADKVGVNSQRDHAVFDDAGYKGMYGRSIRDVERMKGLSSKERLVDFAGATELAANNLRMAMTTDALENGKASNKSDANKVHRKKGKIVRDAVLKGTGMTPEHLPLEQKRLDDLSREKKREIKSFDGELE